MCFQDLPERSAGVRQCEHNITDGKITAARQALGCAASATGQIGAAAACAGAIGVTETAGRSLLGLLGPESDFEECFPTYFTAASVRWNAAQGLLRMASDPAFHRAGHPKPRAEGGWYAAAGGLGARVAEAQRRVGSLVAAGKGTAAHEALVALLEAADNPWPAAAAADASSWEVLEL